MVLSFLMLMNIMITVYLANQSSINIYSLYKPLSSPYQKILLRTILKHFTLQNPKYVISS